MPKGMLHIVECLSHGKKEEGASAAYECTVDLSITYGLYYTCAGFRW